MAPNKLLGKDEELDYIQLYNVKPRFFHFYVFLWAIVRNNYCEIERFIVKIENFKTFLGK